MGKSKAVTLFLSLIPLVLVLASCGTFGPAAGVQGDFRGIIKNVLPSIVKIDVLEQSKDQAPDSTDSKPFFDYFFDNPDGSPGQRQYQTESLGSGIIVKRSQNTIYVVTNAHVVADAQDISVTLDDGREYAGTVVGKDERKDVALVSFGTDEKNIPIGRLGDSDSLQPGDWVMAMGAPYGYQSTVTAGIVSALHRRGGPSGNINDFIQTDASINKGNSGGALVNVRGEIIGINTWITSQTGDSVGLGFSIPINNIRNAIDDFIEVGKIRYGWLGVSVSSLDADVARSLSVSADKGALVLGLYKDSPADKAGLIPGDVIQAIGNKPIASSDDLIQVVGELVAGSKTILHVMRGDKKVGLNADISLRLDDDALSKVTDRLWPGLSVYPVTDEVKKDLGLPDDTSGLIVRQVVAQSNAQKAGFRNRDIVKSVDGQAVPDLKTFFSVLAGLDRSQSHTFVFDRDGKEQSADLKGIE